MQQQGLAFARKRTNENGMGTVASWTPERRAKQAEAIRRWQPWNNSTGPRTEEGKSNSSRNADKGKAEFAARILDLRLRVRRDFAASAEQMLASMIATGIIN